jgi:hypothetical protein
MCVHSVFGSWTWPFFLCRKLQNTNMHFTLCFAKRHCVECLFLCRNLQNTNPCTPHCFRPESDTQCGVLFICRKLQNSEAHFSTTVHIYIQLLSIHTYIQACITNTGTSTGTYVFAHIGLKAPVLVRSPKLSRAKSGQYLGGRPPGNTGW